MIRTILVDDQELVRLGFRQALAAAPDIELVGEAGDGVRGVQLAKEAVPDVVLMDVRMPRLDGITATAAITAALPDTRVLLLTTFDLDEYAFGGLRAGASGFLTKDISSDSLLDAIRSIASGESALSPRATRRMIDLFATRLPDDEATHEDPLASLTPRERDVFFAIARGLSNPQIAAEHFTSESTVKTHVGRVLTKLNLRDRVHVVIFAYEHQLNPNR